VKLRAIAPAQLHEMLTAIDGHYHAAIAAPQNCFRNTDWVERFKLLRVGINGNRLVNFAFFLCHEDSKSRVKISCKINLDEIA